MYPIYKFELTANGTTQRAFPIYKDDLAKDFEKESNQEFFRAKLSGKLTFQSDDYTFIVSQAFDTQFVLEIFISYDAGQSWTSYWRGTFWKTDCEFDGDAETVVVQPTVWDQYNDVIAGLEKEYNLIELAPEIMPVRYDKRPMIQVYVPGQSVIGCFLSGMWWEQVAEPESDETKLMETGNGKLNFAFNKSYVYCEFGGTFSPELPKNAFTTRTTKSRYFNIEFGDYTIERYAITNYDGIAIRNGDDVVLWRNTSVPQTLDGVYTVELVAVDSSVTGNIQLSVENRNIYSRYVTDKQSAMNLTAYEIPVDDIVENNRNYRYVIGYYFPDTILVSNVTTSTPTQWGIRQPGEYYVAPLSLVVNEAFPVSRSAWGGASIWFTFSVFDWIIEKEWRESNILKDAYPLASVISVLLAEIAPGITHDATTDYSQFLYGTNLIGIAQTIMISPKSNIVTAGYDQPAQKAPITLKNVTDMLRDCFRCYWFIDDQNRFRVEHIQYFRNGGSYSGSPVVGIDLTTQKVPRNGKEWAFARNQYTFDKPEMAARYQFGWMDDVTQLFEGYPIDIISKYVNPDNIEQIDISRFTSDIDYILLNPGEISKDGFILMGTIYDVGSEIEQFNADNYTKRSRWINTTTGLWGTSTTYKHIIIPVVPGQRIKIIADASHSAQLAWLASNAASVGGATPDYVPGTSIILQSAGTTGYYHVPNGTSYMYIYVGSASEYAYTPDYMGIVTEENYCLPYMNFVINNSNHFLQNAYVAFCLLQQYYSYDMPAPSYSINGEQMFAAGVKKLRKQTLRFPVLMDPDLVKLVKTNLGNGAIEKLSVNLSSRNVNATLNYDTE